jgi:hypothetical protein
LVSNTHSDALTVFSSIPNKDQLKIKELFNELFKYEEFAYSLFGDKPMSFSDSLLNEYSANQLLEFLSLKDYCQDALENFVEPSEIFKKRWETWKRYRNQFKLKKYLLLDKKRGDQVRIFLINIEAFKQVVNQNINLFKKNINPSISAESLLTQFEYENTDVFDILHHNEGLLGILLGFGKHNAMLFQQREELERKKKFGVYKLENIQNKLNLANTRLKPLRKHDPYIIASINRVCFVADPEHYETIKLRHKYDNLNRKINEIYSRDDWFEQTLIQLTSEASISN